MENQASVEQRLELITKGLTEVHGEDSIRQLLEEGRNPKGFWATAPTGKPHLAYFVPLLKLADFVKAGADVNLYAFLVNYKHSWETVGHRTAYYKHIVGAVLRTIGVPENTVHFVEGSSYELSKEFSLANYKLSVLTDVTDVKATGDEYRNPGKLSVLFCPGLPALAEEYLDCDFQFGGEDQRGLFAFNERFLPELGYRKRAHLMNPMVPGLQGTKMSSSVPDSKIEFLEDPESVRRKIFNARCEDGKIAENGLLSLLRLVVIPFNQNRMENAGTTDGDQGVFDVQQGNGEVKSFASYEELETAFAAGKISPGDLKEATTQAVNAMLDPLRKQYETSKEWQAVDQLAYPEDQIL
ncbi:tyrosyl-tRNA synthetase [Aspergillus clavatus NRRL 1]|uniref:tyrosine--tRNA ligase n=1 Tax=Aspergillus clavatus (strain ATCC 1007 / CBS 513.65 / DSM 816 / NCTC 3887 / NRRL 1 / QM 1276 / 107) TaxID=344612 RepID=A1C7B1_ASPCL|nr:tyrosyl-tRNA synthetase [Aspergillus clavatus NRRL 1]EAW14282.1 tyrosyl-tRNA synthetase [Aspergillus clavatus NRRL 1]